MSFWCLHFLPKKRTKTSRQVVKSNLFVLYLEEMSAGKKSFRIRLTFSENTHFSGFFFNSKFSSTITMTNAARIAAKKLECAIIFSLNEVFYFFNSMSTCRPSEAC